MCLHRHIFKHSLEEDTQFETKFILSIIEITFMALGLGAVVVLFC